MLARLTLKKSNNHTTNWAVKINEEVKLKRLIYVDEVVGDNAFTKHPYGYESKIPLSELQSVEVGYIKIGDPVIDETFVKLNDDLLVDAFKYGKLDSSIISIEAKNFRSSFTLDEIYTNLKTSNPDPSIADHKFKMLMNELLQV